MHPIHLASTFFPQLSDCKRLYFMPGKTEPAPGSPSSWWAGRVWRFEEDARILALCYSRGWFLFEQTVLYLTVSVAQGPGYKGCLKDGTVARFQAGLRQVCG